MYVVYCSLHHGMLEVYIIIQVLGYLKVDELLLNCASNSSQSGVGMITGLDGNTLPIGDTGVWRVFNPFSRPGVLRLQTRSTSLVTAADQGIYTCTIPDSNDNQFTINVGLYPSGFMSECQMKPFLFLCVYNM